MSQEGLLDRALTDPGYGSGSSGGLQQAAQPLQAPPTGGSDAPDRQAQLVGYLRVGSWRIGHEQLDQPPPPPGKAGQSVADSLSALLGEKPLVDLRFAGDIVFQGGVILNQHDLLARRHAAQAFVARGSCQPGSDAGRLLEPVDVLEQTEPCRLEDVGGVALY